MTFFDIIMVIATVFGAICFLETAHQNFYGFFIMFMLLFSTNGVADGSVFIATGHANAALYGFVAFYAVCLAITWWWYSQKNSEIKC